MVVIKELFNLMIINRSVLTNSRNQLTSYARRTLITVRDSTHEVNLNGFKINAAEGDSTMGQIPTAAAA